MWPVATVLDDADIEYFHQHRKFCDQEGGAWARGDVGFGGTAPPSKTTAMSMTSLCPSNPGSGTQQVPSTPLSSSRGVSPFTPGPQCPLTRGHGWSPAPGPGRWTWQRRCKISSCNDHTGLRSGRPETTRGRSHTDPAGAPRLRGGAPYPLHPLHSHPLAQAGSRLAESLQSP